MAGGSARWAVCVVCCIVVACTRVFGPDAATEDTGAEAGVRVDPAASDPKTDAVGPAASYGTAGSTACASSEPEVCDSRDNDCDGEIDEDLSRPCGAPMVGECRPGLEVCSGGQWTSCAGAVMPGPESCDVPGHDENCDGFTDEGCPCLQGQMQACPCTDGLTEPCPGIDRGICRAGTRVCSAGRWSECTGVAVAAAESCDALDNDCDGIVDNGAQCGGGTRCEGGRCVQCVGDAECQGASAPACSTSICDAASGTCQLLPQPDRTRCASGICRGGSCFAGCVEDGDCTGRDEACENERCVYVPRCNNGRVDDNEQCESGSISESCRTLGYDGGSLACRNCVYDASQCYFDEPPSGGSGG